MDILDHLEEEHRKAEQLLDTLGDSKPGPKRERTLAELEEALATHMAVEERFIYPLVEKDIGEEDAKEADTEHELAREGLSKMRELVDQPGFGAAVDMVKGGIGHHVEEEEHDLFPKLREEAADELAGMDPDELEAAVRKAGGGSPRRGQAARAGTSTSNGPTKADLYEQAREKGIEGRSSMTKDELAKAVKTA